MRILLITVAGLSSRFSESVGKPTIKCLYHRDTLKDSLLYRITHMNRMFDRYVIVGGFMYEALCEAINGPYFQEIRDRIVLVENKQYATLGSGYSLYKGLQKIIDDPFDELIFAEGDLFVDSVAFSEVCASEKNVITCNTDPILSNKAVAFYYDTQYKIHYIYDTAHKALEIKEPFLGIFNSGQIWKFVDYTKICEAYHCLSKAKWEGTNLEFVQTYFGSLSRKDYQMIQFSQWINCNTVKDFDCIALQG